MRIEKTILPIVCVLGIAAFIILSSIIGKNRSTVEPEATPEPTQDPVHAAIIAVQDEMGGTLAEGTDSSILSYQSRVDGEFGTVTVFSKQGMLCMRIVRPFEAVIKETTEDPFEDMFETGTDPTEAAGESPDDAFLTGVAEEIGFMLFRISQPENSADFTAKLLSALRSIRTGEEKKANILFGVYMVKLEFADSDRLLTVTCAPA